MGCGCSARRRVADNDNKAEKPQPSVGTANATPTPPRPGEPPPSGDDTVHPIPLSPLQGNDDCHDDHCSVQDIPTSRTLPLSSESHKVPSIRNDTDDGRAGCGGGRGAARDRADGGGDNGGRGYSSDDTEYSVPELDCSGKTGGPEEGGEHGADAGGGGARGKDSGAAKSDRDDPAAGVVGEAQLIRRFSLDPLPQIDHSTLPGGVSIRRESHHANGDSFDAPDSARHNHLGGPDDDSAFGTSLGPALNEHSNDDPVTTLKPKGRHILHRKSREPERDSVEPEAAAAGAVVGEAEHVSITVVEVRPPKQEGRPALLAEPDVLKNATRVELSQEGTVDEKDDGRATEEAPSSEPGASGQASLNSLLDADEEEFMETLLLD